jgi:hypothetical protein
MAINYPNKGRDPGGVVDLEVDENVEAGIRVKGNAEVVVVDRHMLGLGASAIHNGRNLALTAKPARGAAAKLAPGGGFEGVLSHGKVS